MKTIRAGCWVISFLIILVLIPLGKMVVENLETMSTFSGVGIFVFVALLISLLYLQLFILNVIAALGLLLLRTWGFIFAYIAIVSSTFFDICYIPFISKFFPLKIQSPLIIISNLLLLLCVVCLHVLYHRKHIVEKKVKIKDAIKVLAFLFLPLLLFILMVLFNR